MFIGVEGDHFCMSALRVVAFSLPVTVITVPGLDCCGSHSHDKNISRIKGNMTV